MPLDRCPWVSGLGTGCPLSTLRLLNPHPSSSPRALETGTQIPPSSVPWLPATCSRQVPEHVLSLQPDLPGASFSGTLFSLPPHPQATLHKAER